MPLTIGEVAARSGLSASAIRYYEEQGLVPRVARKGGRRIYDALILDRLAAIDLAKSAGFTLAQIRDLFSAVGSGGPASAWAKFSEAKRADLDERLARLVRMKAVLSELARCGCATLAECGRAFNAARSRLPPER